VGQNQLQNVHRYFAEKAAEHCVRAECVLIPVEHPVNGSSIVPAKMDESEVIEYFHIELETHAIIFAEGVPAETLLVNTGRVKDCMETMSGRR
jgi:hypothetical protein